MLKSDEGHFNGVTMDNVAAFVTYAQSPLTGWPLTSELPRSPCRALPSQLRYRDFTRVERRIEQAYEASTEYLAALDRAGSDAS